MIANAELVRARAHLAALHDLQNPLEVQLRVSAVINRLLTQTAAPVVVVGGSAVSFYTGGAYLSRDVDLVTETPTPQIGDILEQVGFTRKDGAWVHRDVDVVVDFPASPLAGDPSRVVRVDTPEGHVGVIGLEDLLIDRLNAAVHWNDSEAREWCVTMLTLHRELDLQYLQRRAATEAVTDALRTVLDEASA
ncbi:MAG: hypothetical protein ACRDGN_10305 [bacterium]